MRILFVGGTRFVGRAIVEAALTAGHEVSVLHRGSTQTNSDHMGAVEHLLADRDKDLSVLDGREFDATVDVCAYVPRQVEQLATALDGEVGTMYSSPRCRCTPTPTPLVSPRPRRSPSRP